MSDNEPPNSERPLLEALELELERRIQKRAFRRAVLDTCRVLIVVAAIAVLVSTMWIPVFQIYGNSMEPTLTDGELIVAIKTSRFVKGDLVAFYYNNKILIKRVIAHGGDVVEISGDGTVYVNGEALDEPYITEKRLGECDIIMPYTVPDGRIFVMGDSRSTSIDSRSSMIGPVSPEQIVGKVTFRVWPLKSFGFLLITAPSVGQ